ncbi:MAG TPA: AarF/UbiB family protein, partial [Aggregatilineaceae bacterium]|nr:AarF/UbiB family protein [Aggregatilineaceae bacterium]
MTNQHAEPGNSGERPSVDQLAAELSIYTVHPRRYRRTLRFALWLFLRAVWWEVILRRLFGDMLIRQNRNVRFKGWAHDFRNMAADMGGVMIKLGQFVSSRVDILPPEVIDELAALQDEVPTIPFELLRETLHAELGPLDQHFSEFDPIPIAAASLGQAHRARLLDGTRVVVKIQRPGIGSVVYTDLKALGVIARHAMRFKFISRRANVPLLLDEFSAVLWDELNYTLEADNAEMF